jgi:dTDP-4-amino-4,6-dideoxygalactose transaminase
MLIKEKHLMHIPMTDLTKQYNELKVDIDEAISRVIVSGQFILGPEVEALEKALADYCGVKYGIGVASGTDALIIGLMACGVKPGDEVITTPFTFIATAEAITHCGAIPVFVDIDHRTYNIDTDQIAHKLTPKTRAIIPVHLFGQPAEMDAIMNISKEHDIRVIEDCAQALSAKYKGKPVGSFGDAGCLSFFPSKNLGAYGDGGMIVTNNPHIADVARILRQHGAKTTYYHILSGFNSRLDAIQAAILGVKFKHLDYWSELRRQAAFLYNSLLDEIDGIESPYIQYGNTTSTNYYTVRLVDPNIDRNELRKFLASRDIGTAVYYPLSLHMQKAYDYLGYNQGDLPETEIAQEQVLSLPMFPEIGQDQIIEVVDKIKEFVSK